MENFQVEKKFDNPNLEKYLLEIFNKKSMDEISQKELDSVDNILFKMKKNFNDEDVNKFSDLKKFPNLRMLTLRGYDLTTEELIEIFNYHKFNEISFIDCKLDNVEFDKIKNYPEIIKFMLCKKMPKKYPNVSDILIESSTVDFDTIDFSKVNKIAIVSSSVYNVHNLDMYEQIKYVNLNGSDLLDKSECEVEDILVSKECYYSHKSNEIIKVDNSEKNIIEELEK